MNLPQTGSPYTTAVFVSDAKYTVYAHTTYDAVAEQLGLKLLSLPLSSPASSHISLRIENNDRKEILFKYHLEKLHMVVLR